MWIFYAAGTHVSPLSDSQEVVSAEAWNQLLDEHNSLEDELQQTKNSLLSLQQLVSK